MSLQPIFGSLTIRMLRALRAHLLLAPNFRFFLLALLSQLNLNEEEGLVNKTGTFVCLFVCLYAFSHHVFFFFLMVPKHELRFWKYERLFIYVWSSQFNWIGNREFRIMVGM